jgi:hypothetical protein
LSLKLLKWKGTFHAVANIVTDGNVSRFEPVMGRNSLKIKELRMVYRFYLLSRDKK